MAENNVSLSKFGSIFSSERILKISDEITAIVLVTSFLQHMKMALLLLSNGWVITSFSKNIYGY